MKALGIVRKMDELGRVVIPMEIRKRYGWEEGQPFEMFMDDDQVIIKAYGDSHKINTAIEILEHLKDEATDKGDASKEEIFYRAISILEQEK